jgi:hypothetical protein
MRATRAFSARKRWPRRWGLVLPQLIHSRHRHRFFWGWTRRARRFFAHRTRGPGGSAMRACASRRRPGHDRTQADAASKRMEMAPRPAPQRECHRGLEMRAPTCGGNGAELAAGHLAIAPARPLKPSNFERCAPSDRGSYGIISIPSTMQSGVRFTEDLAFAGDVAGAIYNTHQRTRLKLQKGTSIPT